MALGLLMIMFVAMSVISIGGVILLFLLRNEKVKKGIYYFMTAWAMFVAIYSATGMPVNYVMQQVIAWGIGFLSVAGLKGKNGYCENRCLCSGCSICHRRRFVHVFLVRETSFWLNECCRAWKKRIGQE